MIDIKSTFLKLTSKRYPYRTEDDVIKLLPEFKFEKDDIGNYYIIVKKPDGTFSNTMFTSHLDTIDRGPYTYSGGIDYSNRKWNTDTKQWDIIDPEKEKKNDTKKVDDKSVKHVFDGDFIKTDGQTNLGADDKAGMTIMLNMISENVPGLYYFFIGEESGCIGSSSQSRVFNKFLEKVSIPEIKKCISFDRKGYDSIITSQMGGDCASDTFANELSNRLNEYGFWFKPDNTGVYTDSAEFMDIIDECTNLSCGYFSEHTTSEKQDIEFLEILSIVCTKIDWETLPIERKCDNIAYKGKKSTYNTNRYNSGYNSYNRYNYGGYYGHGWNDYWDGDGYSYNRNNTGSSTNNKTVSKPLKEDELSKSINDFDFDKWYNEQKEKSHLVT